jgi:Lipase (class 3)
MAATPWQTLLDDAQPDVWGNPRMSKIMAYLCMGVDALLYVDPARWEAQLTNWLAGPSVAVNPSAGNFDPASCVITDGQSTIVAVQGTRTWQQWYSYVAGAGVQPWLPGRGSVFNPFVLLYNYVAAAVIPSLTTRMKIFVTGHSLGAAVGSLLVSQLQSVGFQKLQPAYLFACPVHGDAAYVRAFTSPAWVANHPVDPIPLLPADAVSEMTISPLVIGFGSALSSPGSIAWPFGSFPWGDAPTGYAWAAALAQTAASLSRSAHNTYVYLTAIGQVLSTSEVLFMQTFTELLNSLGLFQPWP